MTNSNNWIRAQILKSSTENAVGAQQAAASAFADQIRAAILRLFNRIALEVMCVPNGGDREWRILLADSANGNEAFVLPREPVVLPDGVAVQFQAFDEAPEITGGAKDYVIVGKNEILDRACEGDVNNSPMEASTCNGRLDNGATISETQPDKKRKIAEPARDNKRRADHSAQGEYDTETEELLDVDAEHNVPTALKFWRYFVGNADSTDLREKLRSISNTLFPDTQRLEAEQIQRLLSSESRDAPPPLLRIAELLLSKARRYQSWNEVVEQLDDFAGENELGFAIDSKGLVLLFQHYLPPVKARQLYQRLAEQNSTLPFAAYLPISNGSHRQSFQVLAFHFRNLFVANIPILISVGLPGSTGKSTFLNKSFDCAFPQSSENAFHTASVDVSLSTDSKPQSFHVFDCHGELPLAAVQLFTALASMVLVHASVDHLKDQSVDSQLQQLLAAIDADSKILVLVRDCTELAFSKIQPPSFSASIQSRLLGIIPVLRIASDDRNFTRAFPRFLENTLRPLLDPVEAREWPEYLPPRRYFSLYEQIEKRLSIFVAESPLPNVELIARSDRSIHKANELKQLLLQLPENEGKTRTKIFPRSEKFAKLCETEANIGKLSQQYGDDMKLREKVVLLECEIRSHRRLSQLLAEILAIAKSQDLEMYEEFLAIMALFKFSSDAANAEPVANLPPEFFWRELLLHAKYSNSQQTPVLLEFLQILLAWGYPIEIINGDTLTFIDPDLLAGILASKEQKKLLVVSVVGPQSSGKSTLMNHLFGSGFAVSAGRCTKGMHLSTFDTSAGERIAVLDSEGLLSMSTKGTAFDNQMAVMLLALSHVVLINVKGEIGRDMDNILEVALLGMQMLKVIHFKPKLVMILRDLTDLRLSKQAESINRISEGMKSICERIKYDFTKVDQSCYELLPSAFTEKTQPFHSGEIHSPNGAFLRKIGELFQRVRDCAETVHQDSSGASFASVEDWVAHSKATWGTLRQSGHLLNYKTLQEYFDREQLGKLSCDLCSDFCEQFRNKAMEFAAGLLNAPAAKLPTSQLAERFRTEAARLMREHLASASERFVKGVENRNFANELIDEYKHCLEQRFRVGLDCVQSEFDMKLGRFMVNDCVSANLEQVKQHGDNYIRSRRSQQPDDGEFDTEFESFWQRQANAMRQQLLNLKKSSESIDAQLRCVFRDLLSKNARFTKYPDKLISTSIETLENVSDIKEMRQYVISSSGLWHTIKTAFLPSTQNTVLSTFQLAVQELKSCVLKVVNDGCVVFSAESIERGFETVEESARKFDEMMRKHGAKFDLSFYTLWFSFLFEQYREKLVDGEDTSIASNLCIFEGHKKQLLQAFTSLLRSRYSDLDSTRELAKLMFDAVIKHCNRVVGESFLTRLRNVSRLEPAELVEICERRNSPSDVKENILRCTLYMRSVFDGRFAATRDELQPEFESVLKKRVCKTITELHAAISAWQASVNAQEVQNAMNAADASTNQVCEDLFLSLKAHLSGASQPAAAARLTNIGASSRASFAFIFELIPNAFVICDPEKFCENLKAEIDQAIAIGEIKLREDKDAYAAAMRELGDYAIGCMAVCPLCGAKCSSANDGHAKHQTKHHRITAFAGCHVVQSLKLTFDICTAKSVHRKKWTHQTPPDEFLPFDQFMTKYHADWIIPLLPNAEVEVKNILRWLQVKKDIITYYRHLLDDTPAEWAQLAERNCPVCLRLWEECSGGQKRRLACGHFIGAECLSTLRGGHVTEQSCPMCRGPLG